MKSDTMIPCFYKLHGDTHFFSLCTKTFAVSEEIWLFEYLFATGLTEKFSSPTQISIRALGRGPPSRRRIIKRAPIPLDHTPG